jgi:excisionase family DNA binding protein
MQKYLDACELAKRLRVTRETVLAWTRRGWVPCLRIGRRPVLFDPVEVDKALRDRARGGLPGRGEGATCI